MTARSLLSARFAHFRAVLRGSVEGLANRWFPGLSRGLGEAARRACANLRERLRARWKTLSARCLPSTFSLQQQLGLLLVSMSLIFVGGSYAILELLILPAFTSLERQGAVRDINRCVAGLKREVELLGDLCTDWGAWDDTYRYIQDRNAAFQDMNLTKDNFASARLSLLALVNSDRELIWGACYDPTTQEKIDLPEIWPMLTNRAFPLARHENVDDGKGGFLLTKAGPLLLWGSPIITSKRQGPIRGTIYMGRLLGPKEIVDLANRAEVKLKATPVVNPSLGPNSKILDQLSLTGKPLVREKNSESLHAYSKVDDIFGRPGMLLRVDVPREVTAQGTLVGRLATSGAIMGCLALMAGAAFLIRRRVVGPLEVIVSHAQHIGEVSDLRARLNSGRLDEIGELARAFDNMVESLCTSRKKVLETAHQAGMADVASEVLHNVGNVINSANASVEQLEEQLKASKLEGLERAAQLLQENSGRMAEFFSIDPRGSRLVAYLIKVAGVLRGECSENQERLERVRKCMRHIQEIIALQEHRAHQAADYACETDLAETFRDVVIFNRDRLERAGVQVEMHTDPIPELMLNRSKLTQVFVNLVRNAIQAMEETPRECRRILLAARRKAGEGVEIEIRDTGCGMSDEVKEKLFQHGFTTKANGRGIGLHYCANAVRAMGGSIAASSEGPGRGSSIHICFAESEAGLAKAA